MAKPDYISIAAELAEEIDPIIRQQLEDQFYDFSPPDPLPEGEEIADYILTEEEIELFEYCDFDYVDDNPGYPNDIYSSYVGVYFNDLGEST